MDENTQDRIKQLLAALQALEKSVRNALKEGTYHGTGDMAVRGYQGLHARAAEILPDDFYVTESLRLDTPAEADDQKLAQVQLAVSQLISYLETQARPSKRVRIESGDFSTELEDLKDLSRSLRDRILAQTKDTIRRAMADIEINVESDWGSRHKRKRKIHLSSDDDDYIGADLSGQDLHERDFSDQDLTDANLSGAVLHMANFSDAVLIHANLSGANLRETNFEDADLTQANMSGANMFGANMEDAVLVQANLSGAGLQEVNLEDADLTGANMSGANLQSANLSDAVLTHANLTGANLHDANLRDADLSEADLRAANLHSANLRDANLNGVNLRDANLHEANFRDANLEGAILPDGSPYRHGDDLSRFHVNRGPGAKGKRGFHFVTPPVPPAPPEPPVPPRPHHPGHPWEEDEG